MKIIVVSPKNKTVFNFRGDLIKDMIAHGHQVLVVGPNQDYVEDVLALGVTKFIEISMVKDNTSVSNDLSYYKKLVALMKEEKPDLVFGYTIKPVIYGSLAARKARVPRICAMVTGLGRVYASHGMKARAVRMVTKFLYKRAFRGCNRVIFQNEDDIRELVTNKYLPAEKTALVNGSGVNMERFKRSPLPQDPVFLMVSRVIREKGVLEYCEAARSLKKCVPSARCILLGGYDSSIGALKPENIREYIEDGSIEFPGEVKDPVSFYGQASVFVLPSYYREGLPRTLLEALSCGRPIITTDWPGCRVPVEDGVNGFMVPVKNSEILSEKMICLARDPMLLTRMADAAYETCKTRFDVHIINSQMRDILKY